MNLKKIHFAWGSTIFLAILSVFLGFLIWQKQGSLTELNRKTIAIEAEREAVLLEKNELQKMLDRKKLLQELDAKQYYTTSTYSDVRSIFVDGKEWKFVHECIGGPELRAGFVRCAWGESTLNVILPNGDKKQLVKKSESVDSGIRDSYLRRIELISSSGGALLLIAYGNYSDLEGRNELSGTIDDAFFNYAFQFKDQSIRKIENFPIDDFAQGPVWNNQGTLMAYVPVFCHPVCVPVPLVVFDLTKDIVAYYTGVSAYGRSGDLEYAMNATSTDPYWERIEWADGDTVRGIIVENGKRRNVLWDTNDPKQTRARGD